MTLQSKLKLSCATSTFLSHVFVFEKIQRKDFTYLSFGTSIISRPQTNWVNDAKMSANKIFTPILHPVWNFFYIYAYT